MQTTDAPATSIHISGGEIVTFAERGPDVPPEIRDKLEAGIPLSESEAQQLEQLREGSISVNTEELVMKAGTIT